MPIVDPPSPYQNYTVWVNTSTSTSATTLNDWTYNTLTVDSGSVNGNRLTLAPTLPVEPVKPKKEDPLVWLRRRVDEVLWEPEAA